MADKFIGLQYPLVKTNRGLLAQKKGVDQIKADLLQLLLTNPGERVMLPEYGTPLRELFFDPNDIELEVRGKSMVAKAVATWEPRIVVENIVVSSSIDSSSLHPDDTMHERESILSIKIEFVDPEDITEIQALVLQVPIS
jgi:phage baseplate assembly protein W